MQPFTYVRPGTLDEALHEAALPGSQLMAGGTTMVDLMRGDLIAPARLVDIGHLPELSDITLTDRQIRFGSLVRMASAAEDTVLRQRCPALAESLQLAASQQLRNAATLAGNILQRTRCPYFRNGVSPCNKRVPGSGCSALSGDDREMALFGISDRCIANYPGDFGTALVAFDVSLVLRSISSERTVPYSSFHTEYGADPTQETILRHGEIITAIIVDLHPDYRRSAYIKVRDRQSYAYALVSAAVALGMDGDNVTSARVSLGGVASRPWRSPDAEAALTGIRLNRETALHAGRAAFALASTGRHNAFKIELGARAVARAALVASQRS